MSKKQRVGLMEVKQALRDHRFRDALPMEFQDDIAKYMSNPGCACNMPIYRKILKNCTKQLSDYFPGFEIPKFEEEAEEFKKLAQNNWSVINCSLDELQTHLRKLPPGRKQIAIARYQDQITVVVNELDVLF